LKELPPSVSTVEEYHANSIGPRSVIVFLSAVAIIFLDGICKILYPAEEGHTFLQNFRKILSDGTLLHSSWRCSSQLYHFLSRTEPFIMWIVLENPNNFNSQGQGKYPKRSHDLCGVLSHDMPCITQNSLTEFVSSSRCYMWPSVCLLPI